MRLGADPHGRDRRARSLPRGPLHDPRHRRASLNDGGKLYWACDGAGIGDRSPVTVSISTEDAATGEVLARTNVRLEWDDEKMRVSR